MDSKVMEGQVVSMEYTLRVDGKVIDSSEGHEPLDYLHGANNIIPGLERELAGLKVGDAKKVVVAAEDGYGPIDEKAFMDVTRAELPDDLPVKPGVEMELTNEDGHPTYARIEHVDGDVIRLNFNHPLAGKELHFDVKVVSLREASDEEQDHGHSHGAHHH